MSKHYRLLAVGAASALLAVGVMGLPSGAAAKPKCVGNDAGAFVCFYSKGDKFTVRDTSHNEMSAAVFWRTTYGREGVCPNPHGKGTQKTCNYDMKEEHMVRFWAVDIDRPTNTYKHWSADARKRI
jgi:hypothetical protein